MEYGYDTFSTVLPGDIFELLLELGNEMGIDPFSSIESENYFRELLKTYSGNKNEVKRYFGLRQGMFAKRTPEKWN